MEYRYTVNRVLRQTADELRSVAHEEAEIEARELVMHSLGVESRAELAANVNKEINAEQYAKLREYILRRKTGEPLQYILGFWEFMGLRFKTDARALIPRQDTETLCEEAIALIKRCGYKTCLDLCAGSGCIGISIANICGTEVTLADISEAALSLCRENAEANGVSIRTIKTDMFDEITDKYDIIVCNPTLRRAIWHRFSGSLRLNRQTRFTAGWMGWISIAASRGTMPKDLTMAVRLRWRLAYIRRRKWQKCLAGRGWLRTFAA